MDGMDEWQKPSKALPDTFKSKLVIESKEHLTALFALAQDISHALSAEGKENTSDVYSGLELLNLGMKRFLNMKFYKEFLPYSEGEECHESFSVWEDFSSKMLLILETLLAGVLRREMDAVLRIKLAKTATKLLEKPEIFGDSCDFLPPWKETLELLEEFHVHSFDGSLFMGKEVREQHLRTLVTLLLCFRYYLDASCEEQLLKLPLFTTMASVVSGSAAGDFDWEQPIQLIAQLASASLIVPNHVPFILSWIPNAVCLWKKINTSYDWDRLWLRLFGRIAKQQPHAIDWSPHINFLYDRIFSCLHISTREGVYRFHSTIKTPPNVACLVRGDAVSSSAEFIIYSLTPESPSSLDLFLQLLQIIEPFYHPNHLEHHQHFVPTFLSSCCRILLHRTSSERKATRDNIMHPILGTRTTTAVASREHRLPEEWISIIVAKLYSLAERSLYSKSSRSSQEAANSIGNLCAILPGYIIPNLVSTAEDDFMSLTMPHRTKATLKALEMICPVLCDSQLYPQGIEYIWHMLFLLLPCVDVNDSTKTKLAIDIVITLSYHFEQLFNEQPNMLEDFVLQWIERILHFLENIEAPAKLGHAKVSPLGFELFGKFCEVFFPNCPETIMSCVVEKVSKKIASVFSMEALKHYGIMVFWIAKTYPRCVDSLFIKPLLLHIQDSSQPHLLQKDTSKDELHGRLRLVANAVRGFADSQYSQEIFQVALAAMKETDRKVYKAGSRLLRSLLEGLCCTTLKMDTTSCAIDWNVPTNVHWKEAMKWIQRSLEFVDSQLFHTNLEESLKDDILKERIFSTARTLHALERGGRWLLAGAMHGWMDKEEEEEEEEEKKKIRFILKRPLYAGMFGEGNDDPNNGELASEMWKQVYQRILRLLEISCQYYPDNAVVLYRILSPIELGNEAFRFDSRLHRVGNQARNYKQCMQSLVIAKYGTNQVGKHMPWTYHRWRMECLFRRRQGFCAKGGFTEPQLVNALLEHLKHLCFSEFRKVRSRARNALVCSFYLTPSSHRWTQVETLFQSVETWIATSQEERVIACMELLQHPFFIRFIAKHYYWIKYLLHVILQCSKISQRQDVIFSLSSLFGKFLSQVRPLVLYNKSSQDKPQQQSWRREISCWEQLQSIFDMLNSTVFDSSESSLFHGGNWRVEAFVFSLFYAFYRPECAISELYLQELMRKYLCSEVMIVRAIVQRIVHLMIQLFKHREEEKWRRIVRHLFSDESFVESLLKTMCQDLSFYDPNEQQQSSASTFGYRNNMPSATVMSLASSFFSDSLDAFTCWIVDGGEPWPLGCFERASNDLVSLRHVRFLSRLLSFVDAQTLPQVYRVCSLSLLEQQSRDPFVTLKIKQLVFGECTVAFILGLEKDQPRENIEQYALDWMQQMFAKCFVDADSLATMETLFRLVVSWKEQHPQGLLHHWWTAWTNRNNHNIDHLRNNGNNSSWSPSSLNNARYLRAIFALSADQSPLHLQDTLVSWIEWLTTDTDYLSHDFEQVREEVARLLCCWMMKLKTQQQQQQTWASKKIIEQWSCQSSPPQQQQQPDKPQQQRLSHARHTLSLLVVRCAHIRGGGGQSPFHPLFVDSHGVKIWLPLLLKAKEDSDVDVSAQATNALSFAARCLIPCPDMESVLLEIGRDHLQFPSFKVRGGTVAFFQWWIFFHYFRLSNAVMLQEMLLEYLFDESVQVREAASRCIISLAPLNPMQVVENWSRRMIQIIQDNDKRNGTQQSTQPCQEESRIRLRHGAVLGASALILSQPFAMLPWMPSLLVQVAYCIHDVPPISTCVRTMFSEFWRSHHEEWPKQKQMLQADQREALNELLIAPSYYA